MCILLLTPDLRLYGILSVVNIQPFLDHTHIFQFNLFTSSYHKNNSFQIRSSPLRQVWDVSGSICAFSDRTLITAVPLVPRSYLSYSDY